MIDETTLKILTESAKFDVSCSSSGSDRRGAKGRIGNAAIAGCCHSFTPDGRCVSLLKILMTNKCVYDCLYCVNRRSNDVPRAAATPDEICKLTIDFYKRNYIEGLFLSSAVYRSPDHTMELLLETVIKLRKLYGFNGYVHLKGIPGADPELIRRAGNYADRMSFNIELPSEKSLNLLAPQKSKKAILLPMRDMSEEYVIARKERNKRFLPAGQTTQMIVGASKESDGQILRLSQALYDNYKLKRVYFSSYVPMNTTSSLLPSSPTGLLREHRLYQADWLIRFYGFNAEEIIGEREDLDPAIDPKCAWALRNMQHFPVEVNTAEESLLLKVPGIGFRGAQKIVAARKFCKLDFSDLIKMRIVLKRAVHFITCNGKFFGNERPTVVRNLIALGEQAETSEQLSLFSTNEIALTAIGGQL